MYINEIIINNFRAFSKQDEEYVLKFSPNINCISGHNGVGKSTILAMLSNIGELKKQYGTRLNNKMFRGEYSEVIKRDLKSDSKGDKLKVKFADPPRDGAFNDIYPQELDFRATFQKTNNGKDTRYRLLPKKVL
ncbi:AAA family ATPase (plasmid) [Staphylococcus equorum]|uniref:AAA family ATPase n=1 Tax=Staphylococcus equorum TaxID=246432 RepID=UPI003D808B31